MSILKLNKDFFTGDDLCIPNMSSAGTGVSGAIAQANGSKLDQLIERKEPEFLKKVLGKELYLLFKTGMDVVDPAVPEQKWIDLAKYLVDTDLKISALANYVWFDWSKSNVSSATGNGEAIASKENAKSVAPIDHQVRVWNQMVDLLMESRDNVEGNIFLYPRYLPDEEVYTKTNTWNF